MGHRPGQRAAFLPSYKVALRVLDDEPTSSEPSRPPRTHEKGDFGTAAVIASEAAGTEDQKTHPAPFLLLAL
jgi:hypothetical protein